MPFRKGGVNFHRNILQPMENILLIRLSSLGDILLTTPAIRAVRTHFRRSNIAMLVAKQSADVLWHNPHLDELILFDRLAADKDTGEMWRVGRTLRKRQFSLTIDFQRKFRTEVLAYFSGAPTRVGKGKLCTVRVPAENDKKDELLPDKHATEHHLAPLQALGIPTDLSETGRQLEFYLTPTERANAAQRFAEKGIADAPLKIGLFPGAGWKLREWMPERFAAIGDRLVEHFNADVLIFGGRQERELVQTVAGLMKAQATTFPGTLHIRELAACISACNLFLTNDTGPMHIATAVKTPTVALFGPGNHHRFHPLGTEHHIIRHHVPCSPCKQFTDTCRNNICMKKICVDEVWAAILQKLPD